MKERVLRTYHFDLKKRTYKVTKPRIPVQPLVRRCVVCLEREQTGSGLCDQCDRSRMRVFAKDETIAGQIKWAAERARRFHKP